MDENKSDQKETRGFLQKLLGRLEKDQTYLPELKNQWGSMNQRQRIQFGIGAAVGLAVFLGALAIVLFIISRIKG